MLQPLDQQVCCLLHISRCSPLQFFYGCPCWQRLTLPVSMPHLYDISPPHPHHNSQTGMTDFASLNDQAF